MGFSTDNKNAVLDKLFGDDNFSPVATHYIALSTTEPTDAGANVSEPSGGSYARVSVVNTDATWAGAAGGEKTNAVDIIFPEAGTVWGTIGWWAIYDAATDGVFQHWGVVQTARVVGVGDVFRFMTGDLVIRLRSE